MPKFTLAGRSVRLGKPARLGPPGAPSLIMAAIILVLGFYLMYPVGLLLVQSFNVARDMLVNPYDFGFGSWTIAWQTPGLFRSLWNSILLWGLGASIAWPIALSISWTLARARIPFSYALEYMFWAAFMLPAVSSTIAWMFVFDPDVGMANTLVEKLPFVDKGPFNIFSIPGIVFANLMANGIAYIVMLLTPIFRNMDAALEEASLMAGGSQLKTALRIMFPVMAPAIGLIFVLQLIRIFQGFEIEQLLGVPFGFFTFSTMIWLLINQDIPQYAQGAVLASVSLVVIALVIPFQRWLVSRRRYTTISSHYKPGLVELGRWRYVVVGLIFFLIFLLTVAPVFLLLLGSFMTRAGFFNAIPTFTLDHWTAVLGSDTFRSALKNTLILGTLAGTISPLLFSILAYILVRTKLRGRGTLDFIIWSSAATPGILLGLGILLMFLGIPFLRVLYGSIWALIIVVVISGNTTGTNVLKAAFLQVGPEMEEAARISGGGWVSTYIRIWIPIIMPTLVMIGTLNFVIAAGATSSIILLATRETMPLSLLALEFASGDYGNREAAGVVSLIITFLTLGLALVGRTFARRMSVRGDLKLQDAIPERGRASQDQTGAATG